MLDKIILDYRDKEIFVPKDFKETTLKTKLGEKIKKLEEEKIKLYEKGKIEVEKKQNIYFVNMIEYI